MNQTLQATHPAFPVRVTDDTVFEAAISLMRAGAPHGAVEEFYRYREQWLRPQQDVAKALTDLAAMRESSRRFRDFAVRFGSYLKNRRRSAMWWLALGLVGLVGGCAVSRVFTEGWVLMVTVVILPVLVAELLCGLAGTFRRFAAVVYLREKAAIHALRARAVDAHAQYLTAVDRLARHRMERAKWS